MSGPETETPMRRSAVRLSLMTLALAAISGLTLLPAQTPAATAGPDSARTALSRQLLVKMHAAETVISGMEGGIASQRSANPNIPEVFWTTFVARAKAGMPAFVERLVPIYATRFTAAELSAIIAFYDTPEGAHYATESAPISLEMMKAGRLWGVELGADVAKELAAQGVDLQ